MRTNIKYDMLYTFLVALACYALKVEAKSIRAKDEKEPFLIWEAFTKPPNWQRINKNTSDDKYESTQNSVILLRVIFFHMI